MSGVLPLLLFLLTAAPGAESAPLGGEAGTSVSELRAVTTLQLSGEGVTRVVFRASSEEGTVVVRLPKGATVWRAWSGSTSLRPEAITRGEEVRVPVIGSALVELAFTFTAPALGLRGRYELELPQFAVPVHGVCWQTWLPLGLRYKEVQSALTEVREGGTSLCGPSGSRINLNPQSVAFSYSRSVLEPGRAFIEGRYEQPL